MHAIVCKTVANGFKFCAGCCEMVASGFKWLLNGFKCIQMVAVVAII